MKMKEVREKTGLTDRAVRIYIEEGILSPVTEESYTGRRSFHFSEQDVAVLKKVSVLRQYDFSIKQIKELLQGSTGVMELLNDHINEMKQDVGGNVDAINAMVNVYNEYPKQLDDLFEMLQDPTVAGKPLITAPPSQSPPKKRNTAVSALKKIFIGALAVIGGLTVLIVVLLIKMPPYTTEDSIVGFAVIQGDNGESYPVGKDYHVDYLTQQVLLLALDGKHVTVSDPNHMFKSYTTQVASDGEIKLNVVIAPPQKNYVLPVLIMEDSEHRRYIDFDNSAFWLEAKDKDLFPFMFGTTKAKNGSFSFEFSIDFAE